MASGNTLAVFTPLHNQPPASNFATLGLRNAHPTLGFDPTTEQSALFGGLLPRAYAGGGITVSVHWMAASATSADTKWGVSFERHQEAADDLDSDSFASEQTATSTAPGTSGQVRVTTIAFTNGAQIDSLAVGESFRLKVSRKAADAADTMAGSAELIRVELRES